jgi:DNA-binding transcriptional ArsR family regulator
LSRRAYPWQDQSDNFFGKKQIKSHEAEWSARVAIRFHVAADAPERIAFAYSPLLETVLSLHVLVEPKHHAVQHAFVRDARRIPSAIRREIAAFSFALRSYCPGFLFPRATGDYAAFATELEALANVPDDLVALEFTRPLYGGTHPRDPAALGRSAVRQAILAQANDLPQASQSLVRLALDDPHTLLDRFRELLTRYWADYFEAEWNRVEPHLAEAVIDAGHVIAGRGLYAQLAELAPEVRIDREAQVFWLERVHEHEVTLEHDTSLVLTPSVFVWPHVRVSCDAPWPLALIYSAPAVAQAAEPRLLPNELIQLLRALGDDTRLRAVRLIAERPRSTQELASLLRLSEAAISKHLRTLVHAELLASRREGYYVLYGLKSERIATLAPSLSAFLQQPPRQGNLPT